MIRDDVIPTIRGDVRNGGTMTYCMEDLFLSCVDTYLRLANMPREKPKQVPTPSLGNSNFDASEWESK